MSKTAGTLISETLELARDPDVFDQETGELNDTYYVRMDVVPRELVNILVESAQENPELQRIADSIVDTLMAEFSKKEVHTILALAGACSLPREVLKEDIRHAPGLGVALASVAMFHNIASDVAEEVNETWNYGTAPAISFEEPTDEITSALVERGFTQIAPGVWAITTDEQQ